MSLGATAGLLVVMLQITADSRLDVSRLTPDEIVQIERLVGGRFWLVLALQTPTDFEVYRLPEHTGQTLRRGQMVWLFRPLPPSPAATSSEQRVPPRWRLGIVPETSWAQVTLPGKDFDDVSGSQDRNRPFRLAGTFRDSELVTLVEFIRSGPDLRDARGTRSVDRTLPIATVERRAEGSVVVSLRINESEYQVVTVRPAGEAWTLVDIQNFIA